jgi:hypothetical protein
MSSDLRHWRLAYHAFLDGLPVEENWCVEPSNMACGMDDFWSGGTWLVFDQKCRPSGTHPPCNGHSWISVLNEKKNYVHVVQLQHNGNTGFAESAILILLPSTGVGCMC